jgi:primosomal protein N' (replication factor Y)
MSSLFQPDAPTYTRFVRVVVERGIEQPLVLDEEGLTYAVPEGEVATGQRVRVPLSKSGKLAAGYVVRSGGRELLAGLSEDRVKAIAGVDHIGLSSEILDVARWMAQYYVCPLGMVLGTLTPGAVKAGTGRSKAEFVRVAAGPLDKQTASLSKKSRGLFDAIAARAHPEAIELKQLAAALSLSSVAPLRRLIKAGVLEVETRDQVRAATLAGLDDEHDTPRELVHGPTPTHEQANCIQAITTTLNSFRVHLLRGVTGSGKTEVYLRCIRAMLDSSPTQAAIVLVPEIALTPQTMARFVARLGRQTVAVLHSGLTSAQRNKEWSRVQSGQARVIVGARSAIFAPVASLGLVIVDEEHDSSYKQDQLPRYHARDLAIKRAQLAACPVVLGSATPSLESWYNACPASEGGLGRFNLLTMLERATGATLPAVRIVNLRQERTLREQDPQSNPRERHLIGPTLERAIEQTLHADGQVILLHNRRGLAHHLICPSSKCGFVVSCESCSTTLVLHRDRNAPAGEIVRCHHCLTEQRVPKLCPTCGRRLVSLGGGTQALEDEVERKFASLGVRREGDNQGTMLRLDSDTMTSAKDYFAALSRFAQGEARIMVGTQMIAKGLDFPGVRLVGIIDADTALQIPDFRAGERTFQLITQAAGRAGRTGDTPGNVIVQTNSPTDPSIVHASSHDFVAFAREELDARKHFGVPPAVRMARIVCRDPSVSKAKQHADAVATALAEQAPAGVRITPASPCAIERIANQFRFAVEVYAPDAISLQRVLGRCRAAGLLKSDAKTAVDVDPVAVL